MAVLFALLFLILLIIWPISIFKPDLFKKIIKNTTRKKNAIIFGGLTLMMFFLTGTASVLTLDSNTEVKGANIEVIDTPTPTATPTPTLTPSPTPQTIITPTSTPTNSPTPTKKPTSTPTPTKFIPTATPTTYVPPTSAPVAPAQTNSGGSWVCDCSKTCTQISSCAEAQYLLNSCGCSRRDGDKDGIACDAAPLHCQN